MASRSVVRGRMARITRLDDSGRPMYGAGNAIVTKGIIDVTITHNATEAEEATPVTSFTGEACASSPGAAGGLNNVTVAINFCAIDPCAVQIMYPAFPLLLDDGGVPIGWEVGPELTCGEGFALEVWAAIGTAAAGGSNNCGQNIPTCKSSSTTGASLSKYLVLGRLLGGPPADLVISAEAATFGFTGTSSTPVGWDKGPYQVEIVNGIPSRLRTPLSDTSFYRIIDTTVRPPSASDGCITVPRPVPDPAELYVDRAPSDTTGMTVRMRVDNHGFGPVQVSWGDGSPLETFADGVLATHTYATAGTFTITVNDQQTPSVVTTRTITVPLDEDVPVVELNVSPTDDMTVIATITMPSQSTGEAVIDWGDDSELLVAQAGAGGVITAQHTYEFPGIYTVTATRTDVCGYVGQASIAVPVPEAPEISVATGGTALTAELTVDNHGNGLTSVDWGDGTITDGPATDGGEVTHVYATGGTYTITVSSRSNPASKATVEFNAGTQLAQPTGLTAGPATATTMPLDWTAVPSATSYTMSYKRTADVTWINVTPNVVTDSGTVIGLVANTSYDFRVRAMATGFANSIWSATVTQSTTT